jgi:hypothetical protein
LDRPHRKIAIFRRQRGTLDPLNPLLNLGDMRIDAKTAFRGDRQLFGLPGISQPIQVDKKPRGLIDTRFIDLVTTQLAAGDEFLQTKGVDMIERDRFRHASDAVFPSEFQQSRFGRQAIPQVERVSKISLQEQSSGRCLKPENTVVRSSEETRERLDRGDPKRFEQLLGTLAN